MKKFLLFLIMLAGCCLSAQKAISLPGSITLESGNVLIRLDAKKRWNINRIEWKKHLLGVDFPGAHYGIVYKRLGSKFAIGTGHDESGTGEDMISLKIFADHKEITPEENKVIRGNIIRIEKVSRIADLSARSITVIEKDILRETASVFAEKAVKLDHIYFIMHPWSTRFDKYYVVYPDGRKKESAFKSDNSFPNRKFAPFMAWYETKSGLGAVTFIRNIKGAKFSQRYLWDRRNYRKDYLCDYYRTTFPAGKEVVYEAVTGFFQQPEHAKWTEDAENCMKSLSQIQ